MAEVTPGRGAYRVIPARFVSGEARIPPDKSLSHRAAMLGAIAGGETIIDGYLPSLDCLSTLDVLRLAGVNVQGPDASGTVRVIGRPTGEAFSEPTGVLDAGNSGTTFRLTLGLLAPHPVLTVISGDASIRRRPMQRVIDPLSAMGARIWARQGGLAPVAMRGGGLNGLSWRLPVASAQVKSAILLAGVQAGRRVRVEEPAASRDHTERMLALFGARIAFGPAWAELDDGPQRLTGRRIRIPGDPSSAAFVWIAAAMRPGSEVLTPGVLLNPVRTEVLRVLSEMGAAIEVVPRGVESGERVGDVAVRAPGRLRAVLLEKERIPALIDELPALAVAAAVASGTTRIRDAGELRHKETDRIDRLAEGLRALGLCVRTAPDGMEIDGPQRVRGGVADSFDDHRLAMALTVAALAGDDPSVVNGTRCVDISFPGFGATLDALARSGGGRVTEIASQQATQSRGGT